MTLTELADLADVTPRTVRFYIAQGLLPPPVGAGSAATYTDVHIHQLKAIKSLQQQHLPLAEIRGRLQHEPQAAPKTATPGSALDYLDAVLGRAAAPNTAGPRGAVVAPAVIAPLLVAAAPVPRGLVVAAPVVPSPPLAAQGARSTWERHQLVPDVELHVRRPLSRDVQRKLDRLLDFARHLFEEVP